MSFEPVAGGDGVRATGYASWNNSTIMCTVPDITQARQSSNYVVVVYRVTASGTSSSSTTSTIANTVTVETASTGTVTGRVTDYFTGNPLQNVQVSIGALATTTAADGTYTLNNVISGIQAITASMAGYSAYTGTVEVMAGGNVTCNIEMHPYDQVTLTNPADGATNVPLAQAITVTFDHNTIAGTGFANITVNNGIANIATTDSIAGNVLTIDPDSNLQYGLTYTVFIPSNAVEGSRALSNGFSFTFTVIYIQAAATDPVDGASDIAIDKTITVTFSDTITTANLDIITLNPPVSCSKSVAGNILTINPDSNLAFDTTYTVTVPVSALNEHMAGDCEFSFSTKDSWDLRQEYTWTVNPDGVWSYGWKSSKTASLNLYDEKIIDTYQWVWRRAASGTDPNVRLNTDNIIRWDIPPGMIGFHPGDGPDFELSVIRWTSPVSGTVNIAGYFGSGAIGRVDIGIIQNNSSILFEKIDTAIDELFSLTSIPVTAGDTIDFWIGIGPDGFGSDSTPVEATITMTP